jgi:hypothetical protein
MCSPAVQKSWVPSVRVAQRANERGVPCTLRMQSSTTVSSSKSPALECVAVIRALILVWYAQMNCTSNPRHYTVMEAGGTRASTVKWWLRRLDASLTSVSAFVKIGCAPKGATGRSM